jgi:hypothetical protein
MGIPGERQTLEAHKLITQAGAGRSSAAKAEGILLERVAPEQKKRRLAGRGETNELLMRLNWLIMHGFAWEFRCCPNLNVAPPSWRPNAGW